MVEATKPGPETGFKRCTSCSTAWRTREAFLSDPDVELVGYQAQFEDLKAGLLLFNHVCQTTLAIEAVCFRDLYSGPVFLEHAANRDGCPRYCQHEGDLRPCPVHCECAYVREILQIVRNWKKTV